MSMSDALGCSPKVARERRSRDNYFTPEDCVWPFIEAEREHLSKGRIWEPFCGDGAIVMPLRASGFDVHANDIRDVGCPDSEVANCFEYEDAPARKIVTNPAYGSRCIPRLIEHALRWHCDYVALFIDMGYFGADRANLLWQRCEPTGRYDLTWRPDWTGEGASPMKMSWVVWDAKRKGQFWKLLNRIDPPEIVEQRRMPLFDLTEI